MSPATNAVSPRVRTAGWRLPRPAAAGVAAIAFAAAACAAPRQVPVAAEPSPQITTRDVRYRAGDTMLAGRLSLPDGDGAAGDGRRPAVLVVHEWWGRTEHADRSADDLARLGYVALAVDMYGEGRTTTDPKVAGEWSSALKRDPGTAIHRVRAALDQVRSLPQVDPARVACIGFCFGGTVALEAAWAGLDLRGVVSFHGSLTTPAPDRVPDVRASVLVCHGAADPFVPAESIEAFTRAMHDGGIDWEMTWFGGAVHSFTNPAADGSANPGARYDRVAAARAWSQMEAFLAERLR